MNAQTPITQSSVARLLAMDPATKLDLRQVAMAFTGDMTRVGTHLAKVDTWNAHAPIQRLQDAIVRNLVGDALFSVIEGHRVAEETGDTGDLENAIDCLLKEVA